MNIAIHKHRKNKEYTCIHKRNMVYYQLQDRKSKRQRSARFLQKEAWSVRGKQSPVPYLASLGLGILLFLISGARQEHILSNLLFSLASGALIIGLVRLLGNMKMFASLLWGTRLLKRVFLNTFRSGRVESDDYAAYRSARGGHTDAIPLLIASAVLTGLSLVIAKLP